MLLPASHCLQPSSVEHFSGLSPPPSPFSLSRSPSAHSSFPASNVVLPTFSAPHSERPTILDLFLSGLPLFSPFLLSPISVLFSPPFGFLLLLRRRRRRHRRQLRPPPPPTARRPPPPPAVLAADLGFAMGALATAAATAAFTARLVGQAVPSACRPARL